MVLKIGRVEFLQTTVKEEFALQLEPIPNGNGMATVPHFSRHVGFDKDIARVDVTAKLAKDTWSSSMDKFIPLPVSIRSSLHEKFSQIDI